MAPKPTTWFFHLSNRQVIINNHFWIWCGRILHCITVQGTVKWFEVSACHWWWSHLLPHLSFIPLFTVLKDKFSEFCDPCVLYVCVPIYEFDDLRIDWIRILLKLFPYPLCACSTLYTRLCSYVFCDLVPVSTVLYYSLFKFELFFLWPEVNPGSFKLDESVKWFRHLFGIVLIHAC